MYIVRLTFLTSSINSAVYILILCVSTSCTIQYGTYFARLLIIIVIYIYIYICILYVPFFRYFSLPCHCIIRENRKYAHTVGYIMARHMRTHYIYIYIYIKIYTWKHLYIYLFRFKFFQRIRWKSFSFALRGSVSGTQAKTIFFSDLFDERESDGKFFLDRIYFTSAQTPVKAINCQNFQKKNTVFFLSPTTTI